MFVDSEKTIEEIQADLEAQEREKAAAKKASKKRQRTTMVVKDENGEVKTEEKEMAHLDPLEQLIAMEREKTQESEVSVKEEVEMDLDSMFAPYQEAKIGIETEGN